MQTTIFGIGKMLKQFKRMRKEKNNINNKIESKFFNNMIEKIEQSELEIARGEGIIAEEVFKEWEKKYGY